MIYFAYGSNLDRGQMAERCPTSPFVEVARLDDHRLTFPRRSPIRKCAVASVEPCPGETVWGALYRMTEADVTRLDRREGYYPDNAAAEHRYLRVTMAVRLLDGQAFAAMTYIAMPTPDPGLPSAEYLAHLIDGATLCRFPEDYLTMLRPLPTTASP